MEASHLAGRISGLQQDRDRFYLVAIPEATEESIQLATVSWNKRHFEGWWEEIENEFALIRIESDFSFRLPALNEASCLNNTWSSTGPVGSRSNHTAVWTGTEMLVWGGRTVVSSDRSNTGGRYNPATDSWSLISTMLGVPSSREGHMAVLDWYGDDCVGWLPATSDFSAIA